MAAPRVALLDIETAPICGLSWTLFETNILHVIEPTFMLSYAIKWQGHSRVKTKALCDYPHYERNKKTDKALVSDLWQDLDEADFVIAHNGDSFDIKKTNARFLVHGLKPPSPYKTIDTLKIARRYFKFDSNKLDNLAGYLGIGGKVPHTGKHLWLGCMAGDPASWRTMKKYNAHDVVLLEEVYEKLKGWHTTHPSMTLLDGAVGCPVCRSTDTQKRGTNVSKVRVTQRLSCRNCGHWWSGATIKKGAA
jgi:uncharacterized protein YprB with RNaseH-like and TPR domain